MGTSTTKNKKQKKEKEEKKENDKNNRNQVASSPNVDAAVALTTDEGKGEVKSKCALTQLFEGSPGNKNNMSIAVKHIRGQLL